MLFCIYSHPTIVSAASTPQLSKQDIVSYAKPAVVRILVHVTGTLAVPNFEYDLKNLKFFLSLKAPASVPMDKYITGTGFVVNPDGYIVTSAHVISDDALEDTTMSTLLSAAFDKSKSLLSPSELATLNARPEAELGKLMLDSYATLKKNTTSTLHAEVVVLPSLFLSSDAAQLMKAGIKITVIDFDKEYVENGKDVALIKMEGNNLPSLILATSTQPLVGTGVSIIGFPGNARIDAGMDTDPSFTSGIITAIKDTAERDFKVIQTDAKISGGSSGSPLLDAAGNVIGIITYETSSLNTDGGDNFASILSVNLITDILSKYHISNNSGSYQQHFLAGLNLLNDLHCKKALDEFTLALRTHYAFSTVTAKVLSAYSDRCDALIASGMSVDSVWGELSYGYSHGTYNLLLFIIVNIGVLSILGFGIVRLVAKMKREEKEIQELSRRLQEDERRSHVQFPEIPTPPSPPSPINR